jgi:pimeloyl-ACP methyl ester carboxylesterase
MEQPISPLTFTAESVISRDGTKIGYLKTGNGPGLILVHGGMMSSHNFTTLGGILSGDFTVYIPDRRGRGRSGDVGAHYKPALEAEDLQALIHKTKTENIFGLSSGAIHTLQTALIEPSLKKIAIYEPPIPVNGMNSFTWYNKYEKALTKGNLGKAFVYIIKGTADFSFMSCLPDFILAALMNLAIKSEKQNEDGNKVLLKSLVPTFRYDYMAVRASEGIIPKCKNIKADILLLGGNKSQGYLKKTLDELSAALPKAKRVELKGTGHIAANNDDKPEWVAKELKSFFLS